MGFFTDIVVVSPKEAKQVSRHASPTEKWPGCEAKSLDQVTFGTLYGILAGDPEADIDFEDISSSGKGAWVSRFPETFVECLTEYAPKDFLRVAKKWSKTEELRGLYEAADLRDLIQEVWHLAHQAQGEGKWLLLCTSGA